MQYITNSKSKLVHVKVKTGTRTLESVPLKNKKKLIQIYIL